MKKPIYSKNGMKQIVDTGYKLFDKQTNCITTGNAICNTQYSSYIRPWNEVKNGGYIGKSGDFVKFDMQCFANIPEDIKDFLLDKNRTESVILYEFCVYKQNKEDVIGWILTDYHHNLIKIRVNDYYDMKYRTKRTNCLIECSKYITNEV